MKISTRTRIQSIRLNDYERFHNQAIKEHGELIEEAIMAELEPIDHIQAMKDENGQDEVFEELMPFRRIKHGN